MRRKSIHPIISFCFLPVLAGDGGWLAQSQIPPPLTLTLSGPPSVKAGGTGVLTVGLTGAPSPSALQFTFSIVGPGDAATSLSAAPVLGTVQKTLTCSSTNPATPTVVCIVYGLNRTLIPAGPGEVQDRNWRLFDPGDGHHEHPDDRHVPVRTDTPVRRHELSVGPDSLPGQRYGVAGMIPFLHATALNPMTRKRFI